MIKDGERRGVKRREERREREKKAEVKIQREKGRGGWRSVLDG